MTNELIFLGHTAFVLFGLLVFLILGEAALTAFLGLLVILANLYVLKQIELFGFTVTCSDVFIVGISLGLGLMQKFFGNGSTKKAITVNLALSLAYLGLSFFHLGYTPAPEDTTQEHYRALLAFMPRIILVSLVVSWTTEQLNRLSLKRFFRLMNPGPATVLASLLAQLWDTVTFSIFGLYGIVTSVWDIMLVSFGIKALVILASAPFIGLIYRYLLGEEGTKSRWKMPLRRKQE
jgi:uncharacterized integral membrane protein (TIGR00697 family)